MMLIAILSILSCFVPCAWSQYTVCNPTTTTCPPVPAFGSDFTPDMTRNVTSGADSPFGLRQVNTSANQAFTLSSQAIYGSNGTTLSLGSPGDSLNLYSNQRLMYGRVTIIAKRPKQSPGVNSRITLGSSSGQGITFFWTGVNAASVSTTWSLKPSGDLLEIIDGTNIYNTYDIEWTAEAITWSINGNIVRTVLANATSSDDLLPQLPARLDLSIWDASFAGSVKDTPRPDFSQGPYTLGIQNVKVIDYSTGSFYYVNDKSGTAGSVRSSGGSINGRRPVVSSSSVSSSATSSPTVSPSAAASATGSSSDLSTTNKIAIGVAVPVGVIAIVGVVAILIVRRRRRASKRVGAQGKTWSQGAGMMTSEHHISSPKRP